MAVCPNCGSSHISLRRDTNINWGRAIVGWAAFGVVGGAVAGVTGKDRTAVACLDCGASWRPADVFSIIQIVQEATGLTLDLSLENHRSLATDLTEKVPLWILEVKNADEKANHIAANYDRNENGPMSILFNLIAIMFALIVVGVLIFLNSQANVSKSVIGFVFIGGLVLSFLISTIGSYLDYVKGWDSKKWIASSRQKAEDHAKAIKKTARDDLLKKVKSLASEYSL